MNQQAASTRVLQVAFVLLMSALLAFAPLFACTSAYAKTDGGNEYSSERALIPMTGDSSGTVFTFDGQVKSRLVDGDLIWANSSPELSGSMVNNDVVVLGSVVSLSDSDIKGDVRCISPSVTAQGIAVDGYITTAGYDVTIGEGTSAKGVYCFAVDMLEFDGKAKYAFLYGQSVYINGTVEGDVTVSGQHIEIGPDANITGTLYVHSGQNVDVPKTATVAHVDTTMSQRNTIDQISEIRAVVAPLFQVGGMVFSLISFAIMAAISVWLVGHKLREANRIVRTHPIPMVILGIALVVGLPLLMILAAVLVFTLPVAIALLLALVLVLLVSVPFTGASLGLLLPGKFGDKAKAVLGTLIIALLLQVPYVNLAVSMLCCVYMLGYMGYTFNSGHDDSHNAREGKGGEGPASSAGGAADAPAAGASGASGASGAAGADGASGAAGAAGAAE